MRAAGRFNAQLMDYIRDLIRPGITTGEIDQRVHQYTIEHGHRPATLGYQGFPKSCCTSINEVICHGIPDGYALRDGDIVNLDLTSVVDGWHGDSSETFLIGEASEAAQAVTQCAFDCLYAAIDAIQPGSRVADIGDAIVREATRRGFSVVRRICRARRRTPVPSGTDHSALSQPSVAPASGWCPGSASRSNR